MDVMALVLELMISAVGRPSLPEPQLQTIETDTSWERTLLLGPLGDKLQPRSLPWPYLSRARATWVEEAARESKVTCHGSNEHTGRRRARSWRMTSLPLNCPQGPSLLVRSLRLSSQRRGLSLGTSDDGTG